KFHLALLLALAFPTEQEESPVTAVVDLRNQHRTAHSTAKLVSAEFGFSIVEESARVGELIPKELEQHAVKLVAPALEHHGEDASGEPAGFSRIARGLHLELFECIQVGSRLRSRAPWILIVKAVNNEVGIVGPRAIDGE